MNAPANPNKALWEKGDFTRIAETMRESGDALVQTLGITKGMKVLDLGCGDGTTALPAAKLGADVLGIDIARNLVEAGNRRADHHGLTNLRFQEGDASNLAQVPDKSFDLVISFFGGMFASKPFDVGKEMVRVTRPGGRIVMGNWIPNDPTLVAQILKISSGYTPPPPEGFISPMTWGIESTVIERFAAERGPTRLSPTQSELVVRHWYNPNLDYVYHIVPSLVAIITAISTLVVTSLSVAREREQGTLEQLLVTPVRPFGLMLGKLVPYGLIGIVETFTVLTVMRVVFDVPINGSPLLLISLSILFLFTALAIGLLISTKAQSQMQALQLAWLIMLPSVLLSGFMFPRESMPVIMQVIGFLVPATHFMEIIRGIVLRGATLMDLLPEVITLVVMGLVLLVLSAFRFRRKLA